MTGIDPQTLALAHEFKAKPIGQHSPALERLLTVLRGEALADKYCLICTKPHREWVLARLSARRGEAPAVMHNHVFHSVEEAEWEVFKLRMKRHRGIDLDDAGL